MKTIILSLILLGSTFNAFAAEKKESMARTPAGISTPDDYTNTRSITLIDGGTLYSGAIMFEVDGNKYALKFENNGTLSPLNQRIYDALLKVMSGEVRLKQIHTFDGKTVVAGDFSYKVVAAINISSK